MMPWMVKKGGHAWYVSKRSRRVKKEVMEVEKEATDGGASILS